MKVPDLILERVNSRALAMLCASVLIVSGIIMCIAKIEKAGSIDVKAAVFEGKVESGSLGLLTAFLGFGIVVVILLSSPFKGQNIEIEMNGVKIKAEGVSYRKLCRLLARLEGDPNPSPVENSKQGKGLSL